MLASLLMFSPVEVRKEIPGDLRDHCIVSLRKMILGNNYAEQRTGLQALSICAGCSKQTRFYTSSPSLTPTKGEMRKILESETTQCLLDLFESYNDAVKYCAARALIALSGGIY